MTETKPRIFLCHAHEDRPRVRELYAQLKAAGYYPWLDEQDLPPGQDGWTEIEKIITDAHNLVLVCLSGNSVTEGGSVQGEIKWALDVLEATPEDTITLIPARLEDCRAPEGLPNLHWVDLFEAGGFGRLMRALDFELARRVAGGAAEELEGAPEVEIREPRPAPEPTPRVSAPPAVEPELILIPAGDFLIGSDPKKDNDAYDDEQPQHRLYLPEYSMAKTPVTNVQYQAFVQAAGHSEPYLWKWGKPPRGKEDHPVVHLTWHDAMAYCRWLAETTGKGYRLPSEAEWEKAARGADGRIYPWGDEWDAKRCNTMEGGPGGTTPVGRYSPGGDSPYGCVDMAGNVWEWTLSVFEGYPYHAEDGQEDPKASGSRAQRGGSWLYDRRIARVSYRSGALPFRFSNGVGFRVCVAAQQE